MYLKCKECGREYSINEVRYTCDCTGLLEVVIDLKKVKDVFDGKNVTLWKYSSFLPTEKKVSLKEGGTPLYRIRNIGKITGMKYLFLKNEGANPTGSFKDRGMTVSVSKAIELGFEKVMCASTGNTAASMAAYSAAAGLKSYVVIPGGKIAVGKLAQAIVYGAKVLPIKGNFDQAFEIVRKATQEMKIYLLNSMNPFRLEGQKTIAFEIYDVLQTIPDNIIIPVGNAGNITAVWKGFKELKSAGIVKKTPKMIGIQAEGASPIAQAWKNGSSYKPVAKPETVATAIRIGRPVNWKNAWRAAEESGGFFEIVTDKEILSAQRLLASKEGIFVEPASAASVAGLLKLCAAETIKADELTVLITTGHGLKDPNIVIETSELMEPIEPNMESFKKAMEL